MPEIFQEELGGLLAVVAQNTELSLKFADGVTGKLDVRAAVAELPEVSGTQPEVSDSSDSSAPSDLSDEPDENTEPETEAAEA